MVATDEMFTGSIPEVYGRFLVPLIFEFYASDLAGRIAKSNPENVLEIAAGTGALTRAMALALPAGARIVATDLNQPMLDQAAATRAHDSRIEWRQADALALPFANQTFDAVACQFGVMFFADKIRGFTEAARVLKPGAGYYFNVWDQISKNEFADVVNDAVARLFPDNPSGFMARTPHGYWDTDKIRSELTAAGFMSISFETVQAISVAASARDAAIAFCQGTPLRNEIEARDRSRLEDATQAATEALQRRFGKGSIEGQMTAHVFTATR